MATTEITNEEFDQMIQASARKLKRNADFINSLNVFPVPDGDTGTNMSLSMESGAKYEMDEPSEEVGKLAGALAKGLLMGARGNSGVILSQIFRGFSKSVEGKVTLNAEDLAQAFADGAQTAYKAVMKPTEGTILTVIREAAKAGNDAATEKDDIVYVMDAVTKAGKEALKKTTDLLPVLKEVGVVDSGGQGLTFVFDAFDDVLNGRTEVEEDQPDEEQMDEMVDAKHHQSIQGKIDPADIKYGYCTQIMVRIGKGLQVKQDFDYDTFYNYLAKLGDSLLVVNDDDVVKVHVHTEHPGKVLAWGQQFGDLATVKVDNMRQQQEEIMEKDDPVQADQPVPDTNGTAIIAIASGEGVDKLFRSLGVTHIISGGQTMNPSTADIVAAINDSHAERAIVLPNNKNIFLAAEQAIEVADIPAKIVHSRNISQGMTALMGFNPDSKLDENVAAMEDNLTSVKNGEVTTAIRDTTVQGKTIKKGNFMGIIDGTIATTKPTILEAASEMVKLMLDEDSEIVTIIYGKDAKKSEAEKLESTIQALDDELEIEVHEGDQPVYPFIVSVE
ncbi:DAK2 domain-containing protein [Pediococcus ethanolidurans]|uniref:DAK2 domain-containing protein n=1 Tax=Pediococcus ethanolidurans TaxID=319653 RepID=UPI001C1E9569|nr:DAK2 domain-containing protein [Pediococcus ethanolidurans]MBU7554524.1 DAK2 domain-containing protein [Pediococcus ethanolidurans]MBU7563099.1 DAK2 domain-containing protein [Pediococcus ethanolidurans]MCV3323508.1 DAK2 domain-containing protein [Pediococcus ethanolidurans]MCV3327451.1 DAK2 domain-containing protein [Pediococcus ethanolidurans]MCV3555074.1 DAK2 domain-containing protein [Pediococcus ethanolidurans]